MKHALVASTLVVFAFACAAESGSTDVNDVRKACDQRLTWKRTGEAKCLECNTSAKLQKCDCPSLEAFSGKCAAEHDVVFREPTCTDALNKCVSACGNDCACVDNCYAKAPTCRAKAGPRDGCVVAACAAFCE